MGIVNVTPDSFSDGGRWADPQAALAHAEQLVASGAHIIDVGGESTRPGAARVDPAAEQARVIPVIAALAEAGIAVSVDTMNAATAVAAASAGALII
ncbi:MAG: dihydropteroate synthase, partial [Microterricola sp.]